MEVPAGQVNFRGSLPCSENNVLQPMLHPGAGSDSYLTLMLLVANLEIWKIQNDAKNPENG